MKIRAGYQTTFDCLQPMPIALILNVHPDRRSDLITPDTFSTSTAVGVPQELDTFGIIVTQVREPPGLITFSTLFDIADAGTPDPQRLDGGAMRSGAASAATKPISPSPSAAE